MNVRGARRWFPSLAVTVALATVLTACSATGASAPARSAVDGALTVVTDGLGAATTATLGEAATRAYGEVSAPGAVMAIRRPEGTWTAVIGYQDWQRTVPMVADVNQRVGSVTKTFTVTALLQLAQSGALSLDDPIEKYVPGMPNGSATLYQLAAMRSGIPSYTFDESFQDELFANPDHKWTPQQLVDLVKDVPPMFEPGAMTYYSNTNTVLLGMVIEKVTGKSLSDVLRDQITDPLHLSATVLPTDGAFPDPHPHGYTVQGTDDGIPVDATMWNPSWGWAAGALISNLDDLLTWGRALVRGDGLLSPQMQSTRLDSFDYTVPVYVAPGVDAPQSPARAYGLGLSEALGWYGHTGELPGFNTVVQYRPSTDTTLVVMVNSDIKSGDCPAGAPVTPGGRTSGACADPAVHIANALADALGQPLVTPTP